MTILPTHLSVLAYTRNMQLFSGLLYFLTVISMCVWCVVLLSTIARSYFRRQYSRPKIDTNEAEVRTPE